MLEAFTKHGFSDTSSKGGKGRKVTFFFPLLLFPLLVVHCLVVLLGRLFKSYLSFKTEIRIVMVTKFLKLVLSQKIRDVCETLPLNHPRWPALWIFRK